MLVKLYLTVKASKWLFGVILIVIGIVLFMISKKS